jgi:hypothetical protein
MAFLLPIPTSSLSEEGRQEQRTAMRRTGSKLFFDGFRNLFGGLGLDTAAKNLRRYRSGLGGTQVYSDQEIEEHPLITEAEDTNRTRITSRTLTAQTDDKSFNDRLLSLKDGEEMRIDDHWQAQGKLSSLMDKIRNPDTFAAFGPFDVRSTNDLLARRRGNRLYVTGTVRHGFDEESERDKKERGSWRFHPKGGKHLRLQQRSDRFGRGERP